VPFEIGGDPEDMMDTSYFMLLSPSANRAKSWACEHCKNWTIKDIDMCRHCYYANPENYEHVAGNETRRVDLEFDGKDINIYNSIKKNSVEKGVSIQEAFKEYFRKKK
jgi:hypothetical protein